MAKKKTSNKTADQPDFEQAIKRLEQIVHLLEEGDIGLSASLASYEEGVKLLRQSYDLLHRAERRIELLSGVDADGIPVSQPFQHEATMASGAESTTSGRKATPTGGSTGHRGPAEDDNSAMDGAGGLF